MIFSIVRTGFTQLRRDRGALIMVFVLPIAFFSIFAIVFGAQRNGGTARVRVIVVDEDHSPASERLVKGLVNENSLRALTRPEQKKGEPVPPDYTAATAEAAVKQGVAPAALIIPRGFGEHPMAIEPGAPRTELSLLHDSADPVAAPMISGILQKVAMSSLTDSMAELGMKYFERSAGGLTPEQQKGVDNSLTQMRQALDLREQHPGASAQNSGGGLVDVKVRDVVGEKKRSPMVSFYAAAIGAMFLLFTSSAAGGTLIDEAETGALDRMLSARVTMTQLMLGKLLYCTLLACVQLTVMFLWGAAVFHVELFSHLAGFAVMTVVTALAAASFGILLASLSRSRAVQSSVATLIILTMSAIGGSMFPRFLMPESIQKIGLVTYNAWAIDGYTKVFWRDEPVLNLLPQVGFLLAWGVVLFLIARRFARRWEYS